MSKMLKNDQKNSIFTCINHDNLHSELRFHNAPSDFHHSSSCFSSHLAFITEARYQVLIVVTYPNPTFIKPNLLDFESTHPSFLEFQNEP